MRHYSISRSKKFIGWDVVLTLLAALVAFVFLNLASFGVFTSTMTVAGAVAALGLGHYLLWGRAFWRGAISERQPVQTQASGRSEISETMPPDEFVLGLNNRERTELLRLLEHSLSQANGNRERNGEYAAIDRELFDKIRMFGA